MLTVTLYHIGFNEEPDCPDPPTLVQADCTERLTHYALSHDAIQSFGYARSIPKSYANLTPAQAWERFIDGQRRKYDKASAQATHANKAILAAYTALNQCAELPT